MRIQLRKAGPRTMFLLTCLGGELLAFGPRAPGQGAPSSRAAQAPDVATLARAADDALNHGNYAAAVKSLQQVVEIQPSLAPAWLNLGYAYSGLHRNDSAVDAYQKAIALQPELFEARLNLGILLVEMNRARDSLEHLSKAVALKPDNPRAHFFYGRALELTGQSAPAEKELKEALRLDPRSAPAAMELGRIALAQKRYADALSNFGQASALDPQLSEAQLGVALALESENQPAKAIPQFERYLLKKPSDFETRLRLARIYYQQGDNQKALEHLMKIDELKPAFPGVAPLLGDVNALLKHFPESEKFYRQALLSDPDDSDLHRALGRTLLEEQKFPEAEIEFRGALKLNPKNQGALTGLASALYYEKRYADAIPLLESQATAAQPPAVLFFLLATAYDHLRDNRNALDNYQKFLELSHNQNPDQEWQARQRAKLLRRELEK